MAPLRNFRILVVEDEPLIRLALVERLEARGFETTEAATAEEGLAAFLEDPDVTAMFTDVNMPGAYDGLELARRVHDLRRSTIIVIVTGNHIPTGSAPHYATVIQKPCNDLSLDKALSTVGLTTGDAERLRPSQYGQ